MSHRHSSSPRSPGLTHSADVSGPSSGRSSSVKERLSAVRNRLMHNLDALATSEPSVRRYSGNILPPSTLPLTFSQLTATARVEDDPDVLEGSYSPVIVSSLQKDLKALYEKERSVRSNLYGNTSASQEDEEDCSQPTRIGYDEMSGSYSPSFRSPFYKEEYKEEHDSYGEQLIERYAGTARKVLDNLQKQAPANSKETGESYVSRSELSSMNLDDRISALAKQKERLEREINEYQFLEDKLYIASRMPSEASTPMGAIGNLSQRQQKAREPSRSSEDQDPGSAASMPTPHGHGQHPNRAGFLSPVDRQRIADTVSGFPKPYEPNDGSTPALPGDFDMKMTALRKEVDKINDYLGYMDERSGKRAIIDHMSRPEPPSVPHRQVPDVEAQSPTGASEQMVHTMDAAVAAAANRVSESLRMGTYGQEDGPEWVNVRESAVNAGPLRGVAPTGYGFHVRDQSTATDMTTNADADIHLNAAVGSLHVVPPPSEEADESSASQPPAIGGARSSSNRALDAVVEEAGEEFRDETPPAGRFRLQSPAKNESPIADVDFPEQVRRRTGIVRRDTPGSPNGPVIYSGTQTEQNRNVPVPALDSETIRSAANQHRDITHRILTPKSQSPKPLSTRQLSVQSLPSAGDSPRIGSDAVAPPMPPVESPRPSESFAAAMRLSPRQLVDNVIEMDGSGRNSGSYPKSDDTEVSSMQLSSIHSIQNPVGIEWAFRTNNTVMKYPRRGKKPLKRFMWLYGDRKKGTLALQWSDAGKPAVAEASAKYSKSILLKDVTEIYFGQAATSKNMKRFSINEMDQEMCISIVGKKRTLDVRPMNRNSFGKWKETLSKCIYPSTQYFES